MLRKYLKLFITILCFFIIVLEAGITAVSASESKTWCFGDPEFTELGNNINSTITVDGLTMHEGIRFRNKSKNVKSVIYTGNMDISQSSSNDKSYISFEVDGPSNIYFVAQTNTAGNARNLMIYSDVLDKTDYLNVNEASGYCYKYRGPAGNIEVRSQTNGIRIYAITVENYSEDKYAYLDNYSCREWNLEEITKNEVLTGNKDFNGLNVFASSDYPVNLMVNENTNSYGFRYYKAIDLEGAGDMESRAVVVDVKKNSEIYITARSTNTSTRQLLVTDKYGCDLETVDDIQKFDVNNETNTYKLTYTGDDNTIYLRSSGGGIRIYQLAVVDVSTDRVDDIDCIFDNCTDINTGESLQSKSIGQLSFEGGQYGIYMTASTDSNYSKAVKLNGDRFALANKLCINVSGDVNSGEDSVKKIRVKAKGTTATAYGKIILANKYGYIYGYQNLVNSVNEYVFEYGGTSEKLYIYVMNTDAEIYSIGTVAGAEPETISLSVKEGQIYKYLFTGENVPESDKYNFVIEYDSDLLELKYIGKDNNYNKGVISDSTVDIIENVDGKITFNMTGTFEKNWSGMITSVVFEGVSKGSCNIKFSAIRRS